MAILVQLPEGEARFVAVEPEPLSGSMLQQKSAMQLMMFHFALCRFHVDLMNSIWFLSNLIYDMS